MERELTQIETLSLRDYIDKEMTRLQQECLELFEDATNNLTEIMSHTAKLVILQDIAYQLEYGFIVKIGNTSLKHHLTKP